MKLSVILITLGHGLLILCLSKLSRGHFEQSVGRGNKEKIKDCNFFYSSWKHQTEVGRSEKKKQQNLMTLWIVFFVCSNILD